MQEIKSYKKSKEVLNQVSWSDLFSQDNYFGLNNSFQYSENINADDELHGIKLAQKINKYINNSLKDCQLIEAGNEVYAFPIKNGGKVYKFNKENWNNIDQMIEVSGITIPTPGPITSDINMQVGEGCMFQQYFWLNVNIGYKNQTATGFFKVSMGNQASGNVYIPYDHTEDTDESISDPSTITANPMGNAITCVLNFSNTRLIVAAGNEIRVYYPELDRSNPESPIYTVGAESGKTGWKKVQTFWGGQSIIALTCTFEYLKVRVQDYGFNTKVFFYQANNDFRSTFVYNQIDLRNTRVQRVYSINGIDYYTTILDAGDSNKNINEGLIALNKLIGVTPVQIFTRKGGLVSEDVFSKAGYFIGPTALDASYLNGDIYMADTHGVFKFKYNPNGKDSGYLKWKINQSKTLTTGLAICENYLYTSDENGINQMRLYDTGKDGYEQTGILISRELEGKSFQGCFTKMLDEIRLNYELNPLLTNTANGKIEVYVSPNNIRTDTNPSGDGSDGWYKVMEITGKNKNTRTQTSYLLNNIPNDGAKTGFEFDRQTITYLIKITQGSNTKATPIVREIQLWYHTKGKTNEIYDLQN